MARGTEVDAVVIGGGISGLSAAFELDRAGLATIVLEAADRVGGAIDTRRSGGWVFERGPNTVLGKPPVLRLLEEAGLDDATVTAGPEAKRRYLWKDDALHPLPGGPIGFLRTPLFSPGAKLRLLREPFVGRAPADREESIAQFVRRRLGREFLDYAVGPFVSGVYAGDPERLSVRWAVPRIHSLEVEHGSLIRGALARRKGPAPAGAMTSFRTGLDTLPERLARIVGQRGSVRTRTACRDLSRSGPDFVVETENETFRTARVVVTTPADVAASLLPEAADLAAIPYAPVVVASFGFRRSDVRHPLDGFGFLAPRRESLRILGCLVPSSIFPDRVPEDHVLLTVFAGGATDPEILDLANDRLRTLVLQDLDRSLGISGDPVVEDLRRWPRAIPQYEVGHGRFVDLAASVESRHPGLALAGNYLSGPSVPDCIDHGRRKAKRILEDRA